MGLKMEMGTDDSRAAAQACLAWHAHAHLLDLKSAHSKGLPKQVACVLSLAGLQLEQGCCACLITMAYACSPECSGYWQLKSPHACRCLVVNAEGTMCLSGSSDHTMRLWDLGQQRCLHTYAVHTDSVWALQASRDFSTAFSGGRDGCAYRCAGPTLSKHNSLGADQPLMLDMFDGKGS